MQTTVRRAVILLYHWIVCFKWILSARKPSFRSFFPLDLLSLPPLRNYFHATSLWTLSPKQHLAWKNPYYSHQPERRKISTLNNQWWLLSSLSYGLHKEIKKQSNIPYICSPPMSCNTESLGYSRCPKWTSFEKGSPQFHQPKGKGESNLIPKRKAAGAFWFIWDDQKHQTKSPGSCEWQRGTTASLTPPARGWKGQLGAACHRKKPVPHHCSLQGRLENLNVFQPWNKNTSRKHT